MIPQWFSWAEFHLNQMFADNSVWLAHFLSTLNARQIAGSNKMHAKIKMGKWIHFGPGGDDSNQIHHYFLDA